MSEIIAIETDDPKVLAAREARRLQRAEEEAHEIGIVSVGAVGEE